MHSLPKLAFDYKIEDFERFVGDELLFNATPEPVRVRLDAVVTKVGPAFMTREGFIVDFSTDKSVHLLRGIYEVRASSSEVYSLYIEPVLCAGPRQHYQSIFF